MKKFIKQVLILGIIASLPNSLSATDLGPNLAITGPAAGADGAGYTNLKTVRDGDLGTAPTSTGDTYPKRITVKWGSSQAFNTIILREQGNSVTSWQLESQQTGVILASGTTVGEELIIPVGNVSSNRVNLHILSATSAPAITEFEVYNAAYGSDPQNPDFVHGKINDIF